MERQYTSSAFTIDFSEKKILLMYNRKLKKWLQPGGHIKENETPIEACIRETLEETGIPIQIIGPTFDNKLYQPIAVENYHNNIGDMIDIQYVAIPLAISIDSSENNQVKWQNIFEIQSLENLEDDIKIKALTLYNTYR